MILREFIVTFNVEDTKFTVLEKVIPDSGFRIPRWQVPAADDGREPENGPSVRAG
jgi:hypothetical protein